MYDREIVLLPPLLKYEDRERLRERLPGNSAIRAAKQQTSAGSVTLNLKLLATELVYTHHLVFSYSLLPTDFP